MLQRTIILGVAFAFGIFAASFTIRDANLSAQPKKTRDEEEEPDKPKTPAKVDDKGPKDTKSGTVPPAAVQPKKSREEEEEPEKSKVPSKIDDKGPKDSVRPEPVKTNFNIAQEAAKATNPIIREFLRRLAIPYDNLVAATGRTYKIGLKAERRLPEGKLNYFLLNGDLLDGKDKELPSSAGFSLQAYEDIVLDDVDTLIHNKKLDTVKRDDVLEVAIQVLQATRRFHALMVEQKKRTGKEWEAVDDKLRKKIVDYRLEQMNIAINAKDWRRADDLSIELANYAEDPSAQKSIYRVLLLKEMLALDPSRDEDYIKVRDAVNAFENIGGGKGDKDALAARRMLKAKAEQIVKLAESVSAKKPAEAFTLLKAAEALDPDLPRIGQLRTQWRDRILYIGVPSLPDWMSPTKARTDSERWAVDLLFESLLQVIPDPELGRHYRPGLAARMPDLVPLGREFTLHKNTRWADAEGKLLDARDVFGTLDLLRKFPAIPYAEELDVIDTDRIRIEDPYRMRLSFRQGVLEPLNRATFKVMPARYLKSQNKEADDDLFARRPFGSGPYRFEGRDKEAGDREVAVFRANPYYSQRPGKFGLPNVREVRFVVPKPSTVTSDFATGQLHILFDVPVGDLPRFTSDPLVSGMVNAYKMNVNRRIWMLAINNRRTALQDVSLRRALSAAIDREKILNMDSFRPGNIKYHSVLTGPFPLLSWATPEKGRKPEAALFNHDLAAGLFAEVASKGARVKLTIKYQEGDNLANQACVKFKEQIEEASKNAVEIVLDPVPVSQFYRRIEQEQDFDLAYLPYDYKDDLYSLGSLLDPSADVPGGRNFLGYLGRGSNPQTDDNDLGNLLVEIRSHRDFRSFVQEQTWKLHSKFLNRMPFIPLWQLDRNVVVHRGLEVFLDDATEVVSPTRINPTAALTGIELWRLK